MELESSLPSVAMYLALLPLGITAIVRNYLMKVVLGGVATMIFLVAAVLTVSVPVLCP